MKPIGFGREDETVSQKNEVVPQKSGEPIDLSSLAGMVDKILLPPKDFNPRLTEGAYNITIYNHDRVSLDHVVENLSKLGFTRDEGTFIAYYINDNHAAVIKRVKSKKKAQEIARFLNDQDITCNALKI